MHPACLPIEMLQRECRILTGRRSGPGGQNRNKVETAVRIQHLPSGITAEASERRSQGQNRSVAEFRLRLRLATECRSSWAVDESVRLANCYASNEKPPGQTGDVPVHVSALMQQRIRAGRLQVSAQHQDFPALLAEAMDHLLAAGWDYRIAAMRINVSSSQFAKLLRTHPPALLAVNQHRTALGLPVIN